MLVGEVKDDAIVVVVVKVLVRQFDKANKAGRI